MSEGARRGQGLWGIGRGRSLKRPFAREEAFEHALAGGGSGGGVLRGVPSVDSMEVVVPTDGAALLGVRGVLRVAGRAPAGGQPALRGKGEGKRGPDWSQRRPV